MDFWVIIFGGIAILGIISWLIRISSNSKKYLELKPKLDDLESSIEKHNQQVREDIEAIETLSRQKSMGFPWLAEAIAEYYSLKDKKKEYYLTHKSHPAYTAAETVREIKQEKKALVKENKIISFKINYYENLFPWLTELISEDETEDLPVSLFPDDQEENNDRVKDFLTTEEYLKLPSVERNQRALDRYLKNRNKSKWQIGRDYEMYVGYMHENKGYSVEYKGILDGFDDLGRDIIAKKEGEIRIIQCKYWSHHKKIHEKHIFQLFGTTMEYWIKSRKDKNVQGSFEEFSKLLNENKIRPIFITSTSLSDRAKEMADALSIEVVQNYPIAEFPRIKCNISGRDKEKIYHLPFDQQYDRTIVDKTKGEFHSFTVKEAENAGFRRAFRHRF